MITNRLPMRKAILATPRWKAILVTVLSTWTILPSRNLSSDTPVSSPSLPQSPSISAGPSSQHTAFMFTEVPSTDAPASVDDIPPHVAECFAASNCPRCRINLAVRPRKLFCTCYDNPRYEMYREPVTRAMIRDVLGRSNFHAEQATLVREMLGRPLLTNDEFAVGDTVGLSGLVNSPELNGCVGIVRNPAPKPGRVGVDVQGRLVAVPKDKLAFVTPLMFLSGHADAQESETTTPQHAAYMFSQYYHDTDNHVLNQQYFQGRRWGGYQNPGHNDIDKTTSGAKLCPIAGPTTPWRPIKLEFTRWVRTAEIAAAAICDHIIQRGFQFHAELQVLCSSPELDQSRLNQDAITARAEQRDADGNVRTPSFGRISFCWTDRLDPTRQV